MLLCQNKSKSYMECHQSLMECQSDCIKVDQGDARKRKRSSNKDNDDNNNEDEDNERPMKIRKIREGSADSVDSGKQPVLESDIKLQIASDTAKSDLDSSENSFCKNYKLRPRTFLRRPIYKRDSGDDDPVAVDTSSRRDRYSQRLSKYRRRNANARERHRMKEINAAFKTLREVLPGSYKMKDSNLTKITTLRLAVDYIQALDDLLNKEDINFKHKCFPIQNPSIGNLKFPADLPSSDRKNVVLQEDIENSFNEFILSITAPLTSDVITSSSPDGEENRKRMDVSSRNFSSNFLPSTDEGESSDPISFLLSANFVDNLF